MQEVDLKDLAEGGEMMSLKLANPNYRGQFSPLAPTFLPPAARASVCGPTKRQSPGFQSRRY